MFIDFEGIDGSGKTTLSNRIAERLRARGLRVCHAREGGALASPIAERIRELTRDSNHLSLCETAELLLYAAREAQTVEEVVRPARERGEWVITDRYVYSHLTLAREGRGLSAGVWDVLGFASGGLMPDLVILVDVEPYVARTRKRCGKIRKRGVSSPSRKGQAGAGLPARVRRGFHELARQDPDRWVVFDNTWASLEDAEEQLLDIILAHAERRRAPKAPSGPTPWRPPSRPDDEGAVRRALLAAVDTLACREPPFAAYLVSGLSGGDIDQRRLQLMRVEPAIVAWGLREVPGEGALALRHALKRTEPAYVARSLTGMGCEQAFVLRRELADFAPEAVARSLAGLHGAEAMALREQLCTMAPSGVLAGLTGNDTPAAWTLRERLGPGGRPEDLICGLTGLESPRAWELRDQLLPRSPLAVLESLYGLASERAYELRWRFLRQAPRAVLETLEGLDDEAAWEMRERLSERMREAVVSTRGLDSERAWALRERVARAWPGSTARSLAGLLHTARARRFLFELMSAAPLDLELLRGATYVLDPARSGAGKMEMRQVG